MIIKPRVLYITDVMTTYRTMSLNLSLWFLCCKLKIFVKARLTNLFRVIIKFRRREKIYASAIYIYGWESREVELDKFDHRTKFELRASQQSL